MKQIGIGIVFLILPLIAEAGFYFEIGIEGGGETFAEASSGNDGFSFDEELNIGGGFKIGGGYYRILGEDKNDAISVAVGYLSDSIDASNGDAEFDTVTLDAIYYYQKNSHRFGLGAAYHMNPEYKDDIDGFARTSLDFDNSLGVILQYSFELFSGYSVGLRYTDMDYEVNGATVDASSVGLVFGLFEDFRPGYRNY